MAGAGGLRPARAASWRESKSEEAAPRAVADGPSEAAFEFINGRTGTTAGPPSERLIIWGGDAGCTLLSLFFLKDERSCTAEPHTL